MATPKDKNSEVANISIVVSILGLNCITQDEDNYTLFKGRVGPTMPRSRLANFCFEIAENEIY